MPAAPTDKSPTTALPDVVTGNAYDKYASANPIERRIMSGFFDRLHRALPDDAPAGILEVGVGEGEVAGLVSQRYDDATVVGIDLFDPDLAAAWQSQPVAPSFADIAHLPFPDARFDLVLAIEVLEHVPDPAAALAEITRVGRGQVVVSVPREPIWRLANMARGKYLRDWGNTPGHIQHWSSRRFVQLVAEHLDVIDVQHPFPWTMVEAQVRR